MVLVDTPVWSVALRRKTLAQTDEPIRFSLQTLIRRGDVQLMGVVRQELLSGVREQAHFTRLRDYLRRFPDVTLRSTDHEMAAEYSNRLRSAGIASSPVDALICAVAASREWQIFSTDRDFVRYASKLPIQLFQSA